MKRIKNVKPSEIIFLEADSNYTILHLENGNKVTSAYHLASLANELEPEGYFLRASRKFYVNLNFLTKSDKNSLTLKDKRITISRRRKSDVSSALKKFNSFNYYLKKI